MVLRDSFGVPMEPEEPKVIAKDYWGYDLYEGDEVVNFKGDLVRYDAEDIMDYIRENLDIEVVEEGWR